MTERTVVLDGVTLNTLDVHDVAHGHANVQIAREAMMKVQTARSVVERIVSGNEIVYGINTGFGSLVHSRIDQDDVEQLQLNLIRSHATGLGPNLPTELVRAMMCVRLNSLVKGHSGCHPDVVLQLSSFINKGIHPIVPRIGSLGASGDLAPLSHLACALVGEGKVEFEGRIMNAMEAIQHCELVPLTLKAKDGLSLINGTSLITG
ncbi:MAG: aromatic amino acid lyase, partial [Candidatus Poseidoniaceae archaeon]